LSLIQAPSSKRMWLNSQTNC